MTTTKTVVCPAHNKPAFMVGSGRFRCSKCSDYGFQMFGEFPTQIEYAACRKLEAPYRSLDFVYSFSSSKELFYKVNQKLAFLFNTKAPRLRILQDKNYSGKYVKSLYSPHSYIELSERAGIVTLVHEMAHHIVYTEKMNPKDSSSLLHGGDFLVVEEMMLREINNIIYGIQNV